MASAVMLLAILLALQGCWGGFTRVQFSQPHLAESSEAPKGAISLDGVRVSFFADNVRRREYLLLGFIPVPSGDETVTATSPPFRIEFHVEPTAPGELRFDPERVTLARDTGAPTSPTRHQRSTGTAARGRVVGRVSHAQESVATPLGLRWSCTYGRTGTEVDGPTCFELEFPIAPPSPDERFVLRIEGLTRNGVPVPVPAVQFRPGQTSVNSYYCMWFILCGP